MQEPFKDGESHEGFKDQTVRMVVKPHVDGDQVRIRLSNVFSDEELNVDKVSIGITKKGAESKGDLYPSPSTVKRMCASRPANEPLVIRSPSRSLKMNL